MTPEEELSRLREAMRPFAAFGQTLLTAADEDGYSWITSHSETDAGEFIEWGHEQSFDAVPEGSHAELMSVCGSWKNCPGAVSGPTLTAQHFIAAWDALKHWTPPARAAITKAEGGAG